MPADLAQTSETNATSANRPGGVNPGKDTRSQKLAETPVLGTAGSGERTGRWGLREGTQSPSDSQAGVQPSVNDTDPLADLPTAR